MTKQSGCSHEQADAALVACVLAGDREAFDILFQRYAPSVQRLCSTLLGPTMEAQDIVQEAALQAFLGLAHLREPARFGAWLHTIASNLARSAFRRRSEASLERLGEETILHLLWLDPQPTLEEYLLEREVQEAVVLAIQDLPHTHRQAMVGFYLHGYHYDELAEQLGVPLSTLKWRLFESRKLLKTRLQPIAQTLLYPVCPIDSAQRKGTAMSNSRQRKRKTPSTNTLVTLRVDSLRRFPFTRQCLAILRDAASGRVLPVALSDTEFDALEGAFRAREGTADELSVPQNLAQRLLEAFGADVEQVAINALAGQTLYATVTLKQGARSREVDMRLSEALLLAIRDDSPIFIERSLIETLATRDHMLLASPILGSEENLVAGGQAVQKPGQEGRLQWEEAVRQKYSAAQHMPSMRPWERLWAMLLVSLLGSPDAKSVTELRTLDLTAAFSTRQVTWDAQAVIAVRLPDQREASWLLVPPALWEQITQEWQRWRELENVQEQKQIPLDASLTPDTLTPHLQQQAERMLEQLVELPQVRIAFLLNPAGKVAAWKGPEAQEHLQRYFDASNDLSGPFLSTQHDLGLQRQKVLAIPYVKQELPAQQRPAIPGIDRLLAYHRSGWRLVLFCEAQGAEALREQTHQHMEAGWHEFLRLLTQQVGD